MPYSLITGKNIVGGTFFRKKLQGKVGGLKDVAAIELDYFSCMYSACVYYVILPTTPQYVPVYAVLKVRIMQIVSVLQLLRIMLVTTCIEAARQSRRT